MGYGNWTRESFVNRLIQSPPEQQLVAFYLVEHKRSAQNIGSDFYSALFNYTCYACLTSTIAYGANLCEQQNGHIYSLD